jgi:hypothetical protein
MSNRVPSEKTDAKCGHVVTVKMVRDPEMNECRLIEASRLLCPKCAAISIAARVARGELARA